MSLRYALLGLLADESASGYVLTKKFEGSLQHYAWHAKHSQIYPELSKLASDGLIEVSEEGPRGRRTYAITDSGREVLRGWMFTRPDSGGVRNEFVLRLFLLATLQPTDARTLLTAYLQESENQLDQMAKIFEQAGPEWESEPMSFGHFAAEYGRRSFETLRDWARWAIGEIDRAAEKDGSGTRDASQTR
jgi:PadR family transcriptional regulator AphA